MEYPNIAGYPFGRDFEVKYYMIQMHYDNPKMTPSIEEFLFRVTYEIDLFRSY